MGNVEYVEVLQGEFKRGLKLRHMNMIAIGGAIGTGLFLTSGYTVNQAGPGGALIAYAFLGIVVYFLMTSLGEMATFMPVAGSFQTYCNKFVDPAVGFAVGWMYWLTWALTLSAEMVAAQIIVGRWLPGVPGWIWIVLFTSILFFLNIIDVKGYGETEFWFAGIKVVAIILFLVIGILMIAGVLGPHAYGVSNFIDKNGGAFPLGGIAVVMVMFSAAYSFTGAECVGMAAGEAENPEVVVPKAINSVFWRILLFYVGGMFVIGCILPYQEASVEISPFTYVYENSGIPLLANIGGTLMDVVILTSLLSCANSGLYVGSRMLWSMSRERKAPKFLGKINKRKVPYNAVIFTTVFGLVGLIASFLPISFVYVALCGAVGVSCMVGWLGISVAHYRFRKWYLLKGYKLEDLKYRAKFFPIGPIGAILAVLFVIFGQLIDPAAAPAVLYGLPLTLALYLFYKIKYKTKVVNLNELELSDIQHLKYDKNLD